MPEKIQSRLSLIIQSSKKWRASIETVKMSSRSLTKTVLQLGTGRCCRSLWAQRETWSRVTLCKLPTTRVSLTSNSLMNRWALYRLQPIRMRGLYLRAGWICIQLSLTTLTWLIDRWPIWFSWSSQQWFVRTLSDSTLMSLWSLREHCTHTSRIIIKLKSQKNSQRRNRSNLISMEEICLCDHRITLKALLTSILQTNSS